MRRLRVLALCDNVWKAAQFLPLLDSHAEFELHVLVAPQRPESVGRGLRALVELAITLLRSRNARLLVALLRGRLRRSRFPLAHERTTSWIAARGFDVGLHAAAVIYRGRTIDAFRLGILNAHIGVLPRYRGRCVMEWALLEDGPTGITTFFVDEGIDTGSPIVETRLARLGHLSGVAEAKAHLFAQDVECYRTALVTLAGEPPELPTQGPGDGVRYYRMSALALSVVEQAFAQRGGGRAARTADRGRPLAGD